MNLQTGLSSEEGPTLPLRSPEVLRSWVAEFEAIHRTRSGTVQVIPQDGDGGGDTGLVGMRILNSPTETYLEPPTGTDEQSTAFRRHGTRRSQAAPIH